MGDTDVEVEVQCTLYQGEARLYWIILHNLRDLRAEKALKNDPAVEDQIGFSPSNVLSNRIFSVLMPFLFFYFFQFCCCYPSHAGIGLFL